MSFIHGQNVPREVTILILKYWIVECICDRNDRIKSGSRYKQNCEGKYCNIDLCSFCCSQEQTSTQCGVIYWCSDCEQYDLEEGY